MWRRLSIRRNICIHGAYAVNCKITIKLLTFVAIKKIKTYGWRDCDHWIGLKQWLSRYFKTLTNCFFKESNVLNTQPFTPAMTITVKRRNKTVKSKIPRNGISSYKTKYYYIVVCKLKHWRTIFKIRFSLYDTSNKPLTCTSS